MDWNQEAEFLFTTWRDSMKDLSHLAFGNTTGLKWKDLAEEIQSAWVVVAKKAQEKYSPVVVFDAAKITLPLEDASEAPSEKIKKQKKDQEKK
jgi:hypothetical protein